MSAAKVSAVLYGAIALLFVPLFALVFAFAPKTEDQPSGAVLLVLAVLAPFLYGALGFAIGAVVAYAYNVAANWVGGIELRFEGATPNTASLLEPNPGQQA